MSKFIHMVAKIFYRYLESVLLTFFPTVRTREFLQHFMSLTLQYHVFLANLRLSYLVLTVLQPTRSERISALTNSDLEYRLNSLLHEYKDIFDDTGALKNFGITIQIDPSIQPCLQKPRRFPFLKK